MSPYYQHLRALIGDELLLMPAVAAVIHDEKGRLLLQQKHDGSWSLPAGAIEPGETPEFAIAREILEETGLRCTGCQVINVLGGESFRHVYSNGDQVEYLIVLFRCTVDSEAGSFSDWQETLAIRYFDKADFPGLALPYDMNQLFPDI